MNAAARAWVVDAADGDEPLRACAEQARPGDRVVLIADSAGERRAELLGLRTSLVFSPAALRRMSLLPRSSSNRSLRRTLLAFDELLILGPRLLETIGRVCAGKRALPPRRLAEESHNGNCLPLTRREVVRAALDAGENETLIGLCCDPDDGVSACDFVRVCQTLSLVGHRVTAIVPRRARELARAKGIVRSTGIELRLLTSEAPMWSLLPALDAAVIDVAESPLAPAVNERARRWMARCCHARGIPAALADTLADEFTRPRVTVAQSRLPVHVARALDAALRGVRPAARAVPTHTPEAVTA